ncbi:putative aldolase class 2 protein PA3430 [Panulirus ornatus]|uniref:putative aldolase class 2 protein PA3430 n=1 Tax=Panulirus ornatus TaxID=150431 RepID=UPI003A8B67FD
MKDPKLLMIQQNSLYFYQTVAYDTKYSGPAMAIEAGMELGQVLGDKDILFMGSHGITSVASTISQAFNLLYYLERAAMIQVLATAMQKELKVLPDSQCGPIASAMRHDLQSNSDVHFYAMYRLLRKSQPDFEL